VAVDRLRDRCTIQSADLEAHDRVAALPRRTCRTLCGQSSRSPSAEHVADFGSPYGFESESPDDPGQATRAARSDSAVGRRQRRSGLVRALLRSGHTGHHRIGHHHSDADRPPMMAVTNRPSRSPPSAPWLTPRMDPQFVDLETSSPVEIAGIGQKRQIGAETAFSALFPLLRRKSRQERF
jgi:hypothetical protein